MQTLRHAAVFVLLLGACATPQSGAPPAGARYVAMGSSFAAGPGIPTYVDSPPQPCTRSSNNYAHQLARRLKLDLVDVSCSGGVTADLLGPKGALPAQLDALTPGTRLVTVTIGGNDLGYLPQLVAAS